METKKRSGFIYYMPDRKNLTAAEAVQHGFNLQVEPGDAVVAVETVRGPDDRGRGILWGVQRRTPTTMLDYQPAAQTWQQIPNSDAYVGYWIESKPMAADLVRRRVHSGLAVALGGDNWVIPRVRQWKADDRRFYPAVPMGVEYDPKTSGITQSKVRPEYEAIYELGCTFLEYQLAATAEAAKIDAADAATVRFPFTFDEAARAAITALSFNYAVGMAEVLALDLLDERSIIDVLQALVDYPTYQKWFLKKAAGVVDGLST